MKHILKNKLFLVAFVIFMFIFLTCNISMATDALETSETSSDDESSVEEFLEASYEFISSDVYKFDTDVVIENQIIDGNAFIFGKDVSISGEIGGDVFVFGENVTITEGTYIYGNIFVCAQNVVINGICYDVYCASETFTLGDNAIIARDLRLAANKVHINGQIRRDAYIGTDELVFPDDASDLITGNLEYSSDTEFSIAEGIVGGNINYTPNVSKEVTVMEKVLSYVFKLISTLLYSLVIVLLIIWLAPNFKEKASTTIKKEAPLSLGVGLLTSIVVVFVAFILLFATYGFGFKISIALIGIFALAITISKTILGVACAKLITTRFKPDNTAMLILYTLLVVLAINLLELIPYIGGLIGFLANMVGLGILVLNLVRKNKKDDKQDNKQEVIIDEK